VLARIKDAFDEEWDNPTDLDPDSEESDEGDEA
jgi:hypothetical protein